MLCPLMSTGSIVMAQEAPSGLMTPNMQPTARPTTILAAVDCVGSRCALWEPVDNKPSFGRCGLGRTSRFMPDAADLEERP